jgi:hypothetical protein
MSLKKISLFDGTGCYEPGVSPESMDKLSLEYSHTDGQFSPLTAREISFMHEGEGFALANDAYCRFPRMYLHEGVKVFNLSDDDYFDSAEDEARLKQFNKNASTAKLMYDEISNALGLELKFEHNANKDYWIDIYIPMSFFDFIETDEDFVAYFTERKYLKCIHAKEFKLRNAK